MWWDGEHACGEVDNAHVGVGDMHVGGGGEHACGGRGICMSKNLDRPFVRTISALSICYTMSCCASRFLVMPNASHRIHLAIGLKIGIHGRDILN